MRRKVEALEREVLMLRRQLARVPVVVGGGGGGGGGKGFKIEQFDTFPPTSSEPTLISCKGTLWYSEGGQWAPACHFTTESGEVGT